MTILENLYASGGSDVKVACLSFECDAWDESAHLCHGYEDLIITLEDSTQVIATGSDFAAKLPDRGANGRQDMSFTIDPRGSSAIEKLDQAKESGDKVYVTFRTYMLSDLSGPAEPADSMVAVSYTYNKIESSLSFIASFHDLVNKSWPFRRYRATDYKGLKYAS